MYEYGTFGKRILAAIVDQLIILSILVILGFVGGMSKSFGSLDNLKGFFSLILVLYNVLFVWRSGQTIGKKIFKLKVVNESYNSVSFWRALLRESIGKIISGIFNIGYLWVIIDKKRQGWHDKIAKTYVLQIDQSGKLIPSSSEINITSKQKITFWLLFLFFGLPLAFALIFILVYLFVGSPVKIAGSAMAPNYTNGQYYMTSRSYRSSTYQRKDIVILRSPQNRDRDLIKRIIGLPGEKVVIKNGAVYINDQILQEPYLQPGTITQGGQFIPNDATLLIPEDSYFVVGDNRDHSSDSREWGFVSKQDIVSKISFCYWMCDTSK